MVKLLWKVILTLYFKKNDIDESIKELFNKMDTEFDIALYLSKIDPYEFSEYLFYNIGEINDVKWLNKDGIKIEFIIETDVIKKKEIIDSLLYNSLEDGSYEGFDNGWTIPVINTDYTYGNIDYRQKKLIKIERLQK